MEQGPPKLNIRSRILNSLHFMHPTYTGDAVGLKRPTNVPSSVVHQSPDVQMFDVADEVVGSIAEQAELEPSCNFDNCHALSNPCLATPSLRQTSCSSDQILTRKQCQATGLRQMNRERRN